MQQRKIVKSSNTNLDIIKHWGIGIETHALYACECNTGKDLGGTKCLRLQELKPLLTASCEDSCFPMLVRISQCKINRKALTSRRQPSYVIENCT